jgi:hypothetical protein
LHKGLCLGAGASDVSRHGFIEFVLPQPFEMVFYSLDDLILLLHPQHWAVATSQNQPNYTYKNIVPCHDK